jgi:hypothetical protein
MAAAVDLEEQDHSRHRVTPAAVARRSSAADRGQVGLGQDPPERSLGDRDPVALGQELGVDGRG